MLLPFLLGALLLCDVHHGAEVLDQLARRIQHRMRPDVVVAHNAVRQTRRYSSWSRFLAHAASIVSEERAGLRDGCAPRSTRTTAFLRGVETVNAIGLLRPIQDLVRNGAPCPASRVADLLRLREVALAAPQLLLPFARARARRRGAEHAPRRHRGCRRSPRTAPCTSGEPKSRNRGARASTATVRPAALGEGRTPTARSLTRRRVSDVGLATRPSCSAARVSARSLGIGQVTEARPRPTRASAEVWPGTGRRDFRSCAPITVRRSVDPAAGLAQAARPHAGFPALPASCRPS